MYEQKQRKGQETKNCNETLRSNGIVMYRKTLFLLIIKIKYNIYNGLIEFDCVKIFLCYSSKTLRELQEIPCHFPLMKAEVLAETLGLLPKLLLTF